MGSATSVSDSGDPYWRDNPQTSALGGRDVYSSSVLGHLPSPFTGRPEYVLPESRSPTPELQAPGLLPNPRGPTLQPSGFSVSRDPVYERQPLAMPYGGEASGVQPSTADFCAKGFQETNVTTWDLPTALMRERPPEPLAPWQLVAHAPSGRWYYHNRRTGETTCDSPCVSSCRGRPKRRAAVA
eukprot:s9676_g2.t1